MRQRSIFRPPKLKMLLLLLFCLLFLWCADTAKATAAAPTTAPTASPTSPPTQGGTSSPVDQWVKGQMQSLPTDKVESYWDQLMKDYGGFFRTGKLLR